MRIHGFLLFVSYYHFLSYKTFDVNLKISLSYFKYFYIKLLVIILHNIINIYSIINELTVVQLFSKKKPWFNYN